MGNWSSHVAGGRGGFDQEWEGREVDLFHAGQVEQTHSMNNVQQHNQPSEPREKHVTQENSMSMVVCRETILAKI